MERVIGIIFLLDLAIELHRFTFPNIANHQFSCIQEFVSAAIKRQKLGLCSELSQRMFQLLAHALTKITPG